MHGTRSPVQIETDRRGRSNMSTKFDKGTWALTSFPITQLHPLYLHFHFTLLSLKGYAFYNSWSHLKYMGWSQQKCKWISRCIHYKNNSTGRHQYDSFSIQHYNAIATCFIFYTTVSLWDESTWKNVESGWSDSVATARAFFKIAWSIISESFGVDAMILAETCEIFRSLLRFPPERAG